MSDEWSFVLKCGCRIVSNDKGDTWEIVEFCISDALSIVDFEKEATRES